MKKLLAILLALTLALTLVPTLAFAQNEDGAEPGEAIVEESKETPKEDPEGENTEESKEEPKEEPQENPEGTTDGETKEEPEDKLEDTGDVQAAPLLTADSGGLTGEGTAEKPYEISTAADLKTFRDIVNGANEQTQNAGACAKLMANIDLNNETWTPIGTKDKPYSGTFDGNCKTISGLNVTNAEYAGLFGCTDGAAIQNMVVSGSVAGTKYAGGIAGCATGGSIEGCVNLCRVSASGSGYESGYAGGIVGLLAGSEGDPASSIQNCANWGAISASDGRGDSAHAGGIAGGADFENKSTITNCYSVGMVSSDSAIHGICGNATTSNSYYLTGTVENDPTPTGHKKAKFADGTVLRDLQSGDPDSPWTTTGYVAAVGMILPLLSWQKADTFLINTADDLKEFRDMVNSGGGSAHAQLMKDIDLGSETWTPIGNAENPYTGTFDGNGHTIKGLYVKDVDYAGLFGELHGTIKNLAVTGYVQGGLFAGGIAAMADRGSIENCVNLCRVVAEGNNEYMQAYAGGIVGRDAGGAILNCANLGAISCDVPGWILYSYAAGIAGLAKSTTITRCYNAGGISENGIGAPEYHGSRGVAGEVYSVNVSHCYWLAGAVQGVDDTADDAKTKTEFANELLALLQNGDENSPWTKTGYLAAAKMTVPLLYWQTEDDHTHDGAQWLSDATSHWKECTCGVIYDKAAHSGGTATSTAKAKCEVCGQPYGNVLPQRPSSGKGSSTVNADKKVKSSNTGDPGVMLYVGLAAMSLTGGAWLRRKKH